ncbi:MAG: hypothetical protein IKA28_02515, partial [Tidjanibacter sp.]|nr:hypothetical protein [Tidjanibacter sp.]
ERAERTTGGTKDLKALKDLKVGRRALFRAFGCQQAPFALAYSQLFQFSIFNFPFSILIGIFVGNN